MPPQFLRPLLAIRLCVQALKWLTGVRTVRHPVRKTSSIALLIAVAIPFGCGAPTKRPRDLIGMFKREPEKLRGIAASLCDQLAVATDGPSLRNVKLTADQCRAVGEKTQELSQARQLDFVKIDEKKLRSAQTNDPNAVLYIQTRGQVWLNHSMLKLAQKLIRAIRDAEANGTSAILPRMNASAAKGDIIKLDFKEIKKTSLDESATRLSSEVELNGRGVITINNMFKTEGRVFDDAIALEINTREDRPFETSLLQKMSAVVLIIPYGEDVYVDMVIDLHIYSLGVDRLVAEQFTAALGSGIKAGLDALIELD